MATLEKIRSKSVLLIIVIGVALLAFIIGDALTNSRNLFGDQTTVAKIGSEKIDYTEYQRKREELNNQLEQARKQNPQQYANFDTQLLAQMAIDQLITEHLLDNAAKEAGISVGAEQLRFYVLDNPINTPRLSEIIQQLNSNDLNVSTPQQAYEVIFNPKANGLTDAQMAPFQKAWIAMEEETRTMVRRQTYQRLLAGTVKANELDKKALYNDFVGTAQVSLAYLPYGQLDEKKYPVSDAEISAQYEKEKNRFKVEETTKDVSFIAVSVSPSDADRANAKKLAAATVAALRDSLGQVSKEAKKEGVVSEHKMLRAADLPAGAVKDYVMRAPKDSVSLVSDNFRGFTIIRMGRRSTELDSIQVNLVQVAGSTLPSRVLARLNGGFPVDSISKAFSPDSVAAQPAQWLPLFTADGRTNVLQQSQIDSLVNANGRYITLMSSADGAVLANVAKKNAPVEIYEFDEITYELKPSVKTVADARQKLEKFLASNTTAAAFNKAAEKAGYSIQKLSLTQSTPAVPRMAGMQSYFPDSRQVVRWVMIDGQPGEVSHIYESKDARRPMLYAVAVDSEYEEFIPVTNADVKQYLTDRVRRSKAGDALVKKYTPNAKSVAGAAQAMGVQPQNLPGVRLSRGGMIRDPKVLGAILGSKPGQKVTIVKGDDGVYVYQITGNKTETFPYNDQQYEQQYFQFINPQLDLMLKGSQKVKNNAYKFEAGD